MECLICEKDAPPNEPYCGECSSENQFNDIVSNAFRISAFSYNSVVSDDFFHVLSGVSEGRYNSDIAKATGLSESHVELIQYLLCNGDHADYGTSPRGCWLTDKGKAVFEQLKALRENSLDNHKM